MAPSTSDKVEISREDQAFYKKAARDLNSAKAELTTKDATIADLQNEKKELEKQVEDHTQEIDKLQRQLAASQKEVSEWRDGVHGDPDDEKDAIIATLEEALINACLSKKQRIDALNREMRARVKDVVYLHLSRNWAFINNPDDSKICAGIVYDNLRKEEQKTIPRSSFVAQYMIVVEDWLNQWRQKVQDNGKKAAQGTYATKNWVNGHFLFL